MMSKLWIISISSVLSLSELAFAVQQAQPKPPSESQNVNQSAAQKALLEAQAEKEVFQRCAAGGKADMKALGEWLSEKIAGDIFLRKRLVRHLRQNSAASPCHDFLKEKLAAAQKSLKEQTFEASKQALRPFVLLAVSAGMPEGKAVLADLCAYDESGDWLMSLRSYDPEAYSAALESSVEKITSQVRTELGLNLVPSHMYGRVKENVFTEKTVRFQNPLLVHSYLSDLIDDKKKPRSEVWGRLNLLYATMGRVDKTTSAQLFKEMIRKYDRDWILSFRKEPVWVQFRLLPLAAGVGGPEIVRELLWLAENSIDEQVRILASSSLDGILDKANSNVTSEVSAPAAVPKAAVVPLKAGQAAMPEEQVPGKP